MFRKEWGKHFCVAAVILFSLWFRIEYQATTIVDVPLRADAGQYYAIGWNLFNHGVASMAYPNEATPTPDSYRGPGYPLLITLSLMLGGYEKELEYLLFIQAVLGALSVALTIAIARQWLSFTYAVLAGVLVAVWPHSVTMSGLILTETFFGFTLLLGTYLLGCASNSQRAYQYAFAGLAFAYSALINPAILLFPILVGAILIFSQRKYAVLFLLCALSLPVAWGARGVMIESGNNSSGRLMENVLAGMEPAWDYNHSPSALAAKSRVTKAMEDYRDDLPGALNFIADRIVENPRYYANWYLAQKPLRFWQWSILGSGDIYVYPVLVSPFETKTFFRLVVAFCHGLNLPLMIAAFCFVLVFASQVVRHRSQDQHMPLVFVVLLFVYATLLYSLLTPDPRYAIPFRPFEILLAFSLLALVHKQVRNSKLSKVDED